MARNRSLSRQLLRSQMDMEHHVTTVRTILKYCAYMLKPDMAERSYELPLRARCIRIQSQTPYDLFQLCKGLSLLWDLRALSSKWNLSEFADTQTQ